MYQSDCNNLHDAAKAGNTAAAVRLLSAPGAESAVNSKDKLQRTPLHLAAWSGSVDVTKLLLGFGWVASLLAVCVDRRGLGDASCERCQQRPPCWPSLVLPRVCSAKVNNKAQDDMTALSFAIQKGHVEVLLLTACAVFRDALAISVWSCYETCCRAGREGAAG